MDFHHPIMNTLWGHGGRPKRNKEEDSRVPYRNRLLGIKRYSTYDSTYEFTSTFFLVSEFQELYLHSSCIMDIINHSVKVIKYFYYGTRYEHIAMIR